MNSAIVHSERKCNFGPSNVYMIFLLKEKKNNIVILTQSSQIQQV